MSDPLKQGPTAEQELFKLFSGVANGFPTDAAVGAAANILLNGLRQNNTTRQKAEAAFDELFGKLKSILVAHYDGAGKRRSVFPFHQMINVPHVDLRKKH
jgi:hypothetical protein